MNWARIRRLVQELGWILLGQLASIGGSLVLVRVLTERMAPDAYGQLTLGLTLAVLVNQVVTGGVAAGIGRYYPIAAEAGALGAYFAATQQLMRYALLAVLAIGVALLLAIGAMGYGRWIGFAVLVIALSVLSGYGVAYASIMNAARQRALVAVHGGIDAWLKIGLALGLIVWFGASEKAVVAGYVLSSMVVVGSQYFFVRVIVAKSRSEPPSHTAWLAEMWRYAAPFTAWGLFSWAQQSSDRWALQLFASTHDVGVYAVLFQLGYTPIILAIGMAVSFLGPIFYQRMGDATDVERRRNVQRLTWRITLACLLLTAIAFVVTWNLHAWLFRFLVAAQYRSVSALMPWMALAGGLFAAGQMLALQLMSEMRAAAMTAAKIGTAILGVVFNFLGAWIAGAQGIVFSLVMVSAVYLLWMLALGKSRVEVAR